MSLIVTPECFKGFYNISEKCFNDDFQCFIDEMEDYYLCQLLGKELRDLFVADLDNGSPQSPIYQEIFNVICIDNDCCGCNKVCNCQYYSYGIKNTLTGLIYSQWVIVEQTNATPTGLKQTKGSNSNNLSNLNAQRISDMRWNRSVESWKTIQEYITRNKENYETFKGCDLKYSYLDIV